MNHWCESCARKNLCYVVDDRPKCFVPVTNTASGTPYKLEISSIRQDEPQTGCPKSCPSISICTKDDTDCPWK